MPHLVFVILQLYALLGAAVAAWFLVARIEQADPSAIGAYSFRPLLIPGLILLWPLIIWRCRTPPRPHATFRTAHRHIWWVLAAVLPILVVGALALRQNGPTEAPPIRLSAP